MRCAQAQLFFDYFYSESDLNFKLIHDIDHIVRPCLPITVFIIVYTILRSYVFANRTGCASRRMHRNSPMRGLIRKYATAEIPFALAMGIVFPACVSESRDSRVPSNDVRDVRLLEIYLNSA